MLSMDVFFFLAVSQQPLFIGIIFFLYSGFGLSALVPYLGGSRDNKIGLRFYECTASSRGTPYINYDLFVVAFCVLFLIYDVDLIFFLSEVTYVSSWSPVEAMLALSFLVLGLMGLVYELRLFNFNWTL